MPVATAVVKTDSLSVGSARDQQREHCGPLTSVRQPHGRRDRSAPHDFSWSGRNAHAGPSAGHVNVIIELERAHFDAQLNPHNHAGYPALRAARSTQELCVTSDQPGRTVSYPSLAQHGRHPPPTSLQGQPAMPRRRPAAEVRYRITSDMHYAPTLPPDHGMLVPERVRR